mmetsp:Transcript_20566/g.35055  ORF Transcript_20566/g.35055 Transcript_20566/m.35055 type:complete len:161 (-) Transcript_20566:63-545(-)
MVSPRQRHRARRQQQQQQQQRSNGEEEKKPMTPVTVSSTTASSITDISDDLSTIQKAYRQYKQERIQQRCSSLSALHDIIEDVQFCGIYFCEELFNDTSEEGNENNDEHVISKEERTKAMDTTFLGKMIQCGGIHAGCFSGDHILSCHDDEGDDCSGEFL